MDNLLTMWINLKILVFQASFIYVIIIISSYFGRVLGFCAKYIIVVMLFIGGRKVLDKLDVDAKGKINLTLDVLFKRPDGYHEVEMIMHTISLKDTVSLELISTPGIKLITDYPKILQNEDNLAYKAAKLMMEKYSLDAGILIKIHKSIPIAAGLAGGSTDAAAVILGMNELFDLKRPKEELALLGKEIGADVPFCVMGKAAVARGIGEKLTMIQPLSDVDILIVKPKCGVSTREVYNRLNIKNIKGHPNTDAMLEHSEKRKMDKVAPGLCNVLEEVTLKLHPVLCDIKESMLKNGALGSLMSGSGPSVFGIFESAKDAEKAAEKFLRKGNEVFVAKME